MTVSDAPVDVWRQPEILRDFRAAGVLEASDIHLATTLARLAGEHDPQVVLAVALAARAPRHGDVAVDLATVRAHAAADLADHADMLDELPWPRADAWFDAVCASVLVAPTDGTAPPIVVHAGLVYLERYRTYEQVVARHLRRRAELAAPSLTADAGESPTDRGAAGTVDTADVIERLLTGPGADRQRAAVRASLRSSLTILLGGPGTGKTTTVAAMVAALIEAAPPERRSTALRIALAAPTGKAAARLGEAFRDAAERLSPELAAALSGTETSTIHRLLRPVPGSRTRFRHHAADPLPHDVVIVDESSMISLPLMARLLDAVRPDARMVVVGDPGQLASVETGSVLGDIAGPLADVVPVRAADGEHHDPVAGPAVDAGGAPGASGSAGPLAGCITVLEHSRRFPPSSPLSELAAAIRIGDVDHATRVLADPSSSSAEQGALEWLASPADGQEAIERVRGLVVAPLLDVVAQATAGHVRAALDALGAIRVLCAHRLGGFGVERWNRHIEGWLAADGVDTTGWYPGRPVLVTANDHRNRLYNGDLGVVVLHEHRPSVAFEHVEHLDAGADHRLIGPARLDAIETTHAMTIHKSQGSEFDHVVVILPPADSRLASRELLYTAITRARRLVTVVGDEAALAAAISQRTVRASRLRSDLWESPTG